MPLEDRHGREYLEMNLLGFVEWYFYPLLFPLAIRSSDDHSPSRPPPLSLPTTRLFTGIPFLPQAFLSLTWIKYSFFFWILLLSFCYFLLPLQGNFLLVRWILLGVKYFWDSINFLKAFMCEREITTNT